MITIKSGLFLKSMLLMLFIILSFVVDKVWDIPDNPVTISIIIFFWISIFYLFFKNFFKKYKYVIIGTYTIILILFLYFRLGISEEAYFNTYKDTFLILLFFPIPLFFLLYIFEHWKWVKNLKIAKESAELALLRQQINPHFLFNTLNNAYGLTVEKSDKAPEVILKLSDLLRYTLYEGQNDNVSLESEIIYLSNYLDLCKLRYQRKVDFKFIKRVDNNYKIAPMLLIVMLENAIKHGPDNLKGNAYIYTELIAENRNLSFTVKNNYKKSNSKDYSNKGIGLDNLKQRLKLLYPNSHKLKQTDNGNEYSITLILESI